MEKIIREYVDKFGVVELYKDYLISILEGYNKLKQPTEEATELAESALNVLQTLNAGYIGQDILKTANTVYKKLDKMIKNTNGLIIKISDEIYKNKDYHITFDLDLSKL